MAVELLRAINNYIGLSSDTKPTAGVDTGSVFTETDTGVQYEFDGTNWFIKTTPVSLTDIEGRVQEFDNLFSIPVVVDVSHHEVHEGDMYVATHYDEDAALSHTLSLHFTTPATANPQKRCHAVFEYESSGEYYLQFLEGATYTSGGTAFTPLNRRRDSTKTSAMQTFRRGSSKNSDAIVTGGSPVTIKEEWLGSGKGAGSGARSVEEWILKPNTQYLFRITSKAAGIKLFIRMVWYEHTDE